MSEDTLIVEPGFYPDIDERTYHEDALCAEPSLSCSIAQTILTRSPAHAAVAHPRLSRFRQERDETKFVMGTALHELLLGGEDRFAVVDAEDWRKKDAQAAREEAQAAGRIALLRHKFDELRVVVEVVREQMEEHPDLRGIMAPENPREGTLVWRDGRTGIWCRCRPDLIAPAALVDFKLTGAIATPEQWASRTAFDLLYDFRACWYRRGFRAVTGEDRKYWFVVVENEPPYALSLFEATPQALELAHEGVEKAIDLWERCLRGRTWPGYSTNRQWLDPPAWARSRWEAVQARASLDTGQMIELALEMQRPQQELTS